MLRMQLCFLAVLTCSLVVGCGGGGPTTYPASGKVTYDGKPVPFGNVALIPEASNKGPQAYASIKDGVFATEPEKGHGGGAYVVQVTGFDGVPVEGGEGMDEMGSELFPKYEMTVDLPTGAKELAIDVPASP